MLNELSYCQRTIPFFVQTLLSKNAPQEYEIEGSVPLGIVEALCREMEVEDFMLIEPNNDVMLLFPDVFGTYRDDR